MKNVFKEQGMNGFYKGFTPPLIAQGVYKSIIFTVNTYVYRKTNDSFISGMIAGAVNSLVVCPVELIRTKQILSPAASISSSLSVVQVLQDVIRSNGYSGLWATLGPTITRDGPGLGFYFISFNYLKISLSSFIPAITDTIWVKIIAGMGAGVFFWMWVRPSSFSYNYYHSVTNSLTYSLVHKALPIDTIKTVIEANINRNTNTLTIIKNMHKEGGVARFYRGWIFAFGRGIPAASITLTVYDCVSDYILKGK